VNLTKISNLPALAIAVLMTAVVSPADASTPPEGFRALFNAEDLAGWYASDPNLVAPSAGEAEKKDIARPLADFPMHWTVENGELVSDGQGPSAATRDAFGNFELRVEYKMVLGASGGVFLRGVPGVEIGDGQQDADPGRAWVGSGGLGGNRPATLGRDPLVPADKPAGEWNTLRIRQVGHWTWVWLNSQEVVLGSELENSLDRGNPLPDSGPVMLRAQGGEIRWRNIFIQEIPEDEAANILARHRPYPNPTGYNIPYGPHPKQVLHFWKAESKKPTPVVFYIHGGGWNGGHRMSGMGPMLERFLIGGISVVSIEYRFIQDANAGGIVPPVKAPLQDAARALQLVRSKAAEWNIDKQRIAATGASAGACSSLWLAFHPDMADPDSDDPVSRESTRLFCAAVQGAQTTLDPRQMKEWTPNSTYGSHAFGLGTFDEFLARRESILPWIAEYSPYALVTPDDPPVYLSYWADPALGQPVKDPVHTANFGVKLQEHCKAVGVECELVYPSATDVQHETVTHYLLQTLTRNPQAEEQAMMEKNNNARWLIGRAVQWYENQPWPLGFNYIPAHVISYTEMWMPYAFDAEVIDKELALAEDIGFNCLRVVLPFVVWEHDPEAFKQRLETFLAICDKRGLKVMFSLFDDCVFGPIKDPVYGQQPEVVKGWYANGWTPSPGHGMVQDASTWPRLEVYVKDVIGAFKDDARVWVWDLYNEPINGGFPDQPLTLMRRVFEWARAVAPSQPLTVAEFNGNPELNEIIAANCDIITFHNYDGSERVTQIIERLRKHGRPIINTEWLNRPNGSTVEGVLPVFVREGVGAMHWGLVNGKTQTHLHWGWRPEKGEPDIWQHDIFRGDHTPYDEKEIDLFRTAIQSRKNLRPSVKLVDGIRPELPPIKPLFNYPMRDTAICLAEDGNYYLTGTTGHPTWWKTNDGIRVWRSSDLKEWEPLGLVWSFEKDATWQEALGTQRGIWAPEIHYINGTFWIPYCMNYLREKIGWGDTGLLKSISGKPEGPYVDVKTDGPLTTRIDASLFQDDDGQVYFVWQNGLIARMNEDMSGLAEEPRMLRPSNYGHVGFEGAFIVKVNGRYLLLCAEANGKGKEHTYDLMVASSDNLYGPYGERYLAIPHAGHSTLFKDKEGQWWATYFGSVQSAPLVERPSIVPVHIDQDGILRPVMPE
jgi:acetyl esterase/lipase